MKRTYLGVLRKEDQTDFWVDFPDIRGCVAGGPNRGEAIQNAAAALKAHIDALADAGVGVASPSERNAIIAAERDRFVELVPIEVELPAQSNVRLMTGRSPTLGRT